MALSVARFVEQIPAASTTPIVRTGAGFAPKFALVRWVSLDGTGVASQELQQGYGLVSASANAGVVRQSIDNRASSTRAAAGISGTHAIIEADAASGAVLSGWASIALDADGYTITIADDFRQAFKVEVTVFGGTSIAAVVGSRTSPASGGSFATTVTGITPNVVILLHGGSRMTALGDVANATAAGIGIGAATSASARWNVVSGEDPQVSVSAMWGMVRTDRVATFVQGGGIESELDLVSFAADTFTLDKSGSDTSRTSAFAYAALAVDQAWVGTILAQTSTGAFSTSAVGFQGSFALACGRAGVTASETALATGATAGEHSSGVALSASDRQAMWAHAEGGLDLGGGAVSDVFVARRTDAFWLDYNRTGANTATLQSEIDFEGFTATGLNFDQVDADAVATRIPMLVLGASGGGGGGGGSSPLIDGALMSTAYSGLVR